MHSILQRSIAAAAIAFVVLALPAHSQVYKPDFIRYKLENGLNVVLHRDTTTGSVSVNTAYLAGSAFDPKGKSGLANLCGSLAALSSKGVRYNDLLRIKYFAAASISGMTNSDAVSISSTFPQHWLETALWVEADRMRGAPEGVSETILQSVKQNVVRKKRGELRDALADINERVYAELYPDTHPYHNVSAGDTVDIKKIAMNDVQSFMKKYFVPANASLTLAGNFEIEDAKSLIEKYFGSIPPGKRQSWGKIPKLTPLGKANIVKEANIGYSQMYLVFPTVGRRHPDAPALHMLAHALTGSLNAVLQSEVAKKNPYVVAVEASQNSRELEGEFWITFTCKFGAQFRDLYPMVERALKSYASAQLFETDLTECRNQSLLSYSHAMEQLFGVGGRAETLNTGALLNDSPLHSTSLFETGYALPPQALQAAIDKYLSMKDVLVCSVVPQGKKENGIVFQ